MKQIMLPNGRPTTQLGFGCGSLHGGPHTSRSARLIDIAVETGFRHFDVAPSYGLGLAESVLGQSLRGRRHNITVTTKAGIGRSRIGYLLSSLRYVSKPLLSRFPGWSAAASAARKVSAPKGTFDAQGIRKSLEGSLHRLGTEHVDIFLMHEMRVDQVTDRLIDMLLERKADGVVGALGTGTSREDAMAIAATTPALSDVRQFGWDVTKPPLNAPAGSLTITHGAIWPALRQLGELLAADRPLCKEWTAALGVDLSDRVAQADLVLGAALAENPQGIVLVSSQQPVRIRRFVEVASDARWHAKGAKLLELLRRRVGVSTG